MQSDKGNNFNFEELIVWQKAVLFAENVIRTLDDIETPGANITDLSNSWNPPAPALQ